MKDKVYMVMELVIGGELFDCIIVKGFFSEKDVIRVFIMVLDGVKYLYGLGIIYRDLKFENLFYYYLGYDFKIMIIDFGFSVMKKGVD